MSEMSETGETSQDQEEPENTGEPTFVQTTYSRDDWRPGEIARNKGTGVLKNGDVLFGAYEITGILGQGGMGAVYSARHLDLGSTRAIKVMSAALSADLDAVERFHREARALLDVHHPAVVRCHDLLRDESGCIYLVMELIDGTTLSRRLAERPLSEPELRDLAQRIGGGLAAAHAQGVIHRDLSPDNVVLPDGRADQAKLVDFGIAKVLRDDENTTSVGFKGKLAYASPEQLGFFDGEIGPASDFFSLGLLLCGAATGRQIDMGKNFATAIAARRTPIAIPDPVPQSLRIGLKKLLALDPKERPQSTAGLFEESLTRIDSGITPKRSAMGIAVGLTLGIGVGTWGLWGTLPFGSSTNLSTQITTVSAPMPAEARRKTKLGNRVSLTSNPINNSEDPTQIDIGLETQQQFEALRSRLIAARSQSLTAVPRFEVTPDPVQDRATYSLEIQADCACYPLVFFIDANQDKILLLYPNPNEPRVSLGENHPFTIPSTRGLYSFEAEAGTGLDRLKLLLLSEPVNFPVVATAWSANIDPVPADDEADVSEDGDLLVRFLAPPSDRSRVAGDDEFWSVSPLDTDRAHLEELASLLENLDSSAWSAAETVLHVVR